MDAVAAGALGAVAGAGAGLLPGLHVNTVCAIALAAAPPTPATAVALAAAGSAHVFTSLLPSTYLGVPGEDSGLGLLPAHRLTLRGRGPDAVRLGVRGGLAGMLAAGALLLPHKWMLREPVGLLAWLGPHMTWVLCGLLALVLVRELPGGLAHMARVLAVGTLAAVLGLVSARIPVRALLPGVAASGLLPLLSGLFGVPALLDAAGATRSIPEQEPPRPGLRLHRASAAGGVAAAAFGCLLPGLTSSVTLASTRWGRGTDPSGRGFLSAQAALTGAQLVFSFGVLWVAARPRTGLAVAVATLWPSPAWTSGAPPAPMLPVLAACLLGAGLGGAGACWLDGPASRVLPRVGRAASLAALAFVTALVAALSGGRGLAIFAVAALVGSVPPRLGVARLHLTCCLLVPVLLLRLGWV